MRTKRLYFILFGLLLAGGLVAFFSWNREPEYGGKKLSEWVDGITQITFIIRQGESRNSTRREVVLAIREIGTNAVPYLLTWVRYKPPAWKTRSIQFINRIFHKTFMDRRAYRAYGARLGIAILGAGAEVDLLFEDIPIRGGTPEFVNVELAAERKTDPAVRRCVLFYLLRDRELRVRIAATNALLKLDAEALRKEAH